ncbi:MAG TPA: rhomboid family intramembrane serine protease [Waddliaceae bacterium]
MRYATSDFRVGPEFTPRPIKNLILSTCAISLAVSLGDLVFYQLFGFSGPEEWLCLSWIGLSHYLIWQPFTYLFVQCTGGFGITLSFLITLLFQMYLLWVIGSQVLERIGRASFLRLYFISGILAGIGALLLMQLTGYNPILSGPTPAIFATLVVWTMICPEAELLLFFLIPIKAKWLTLGILSAVFLISLSSFNFVSFALYFFGCLAGYLCALTEWGLRSPFPGFNRLESIILAWSNKFRSSLPFRSQTNQNLPKSSSPKIFDISTGEPELEDDKFVDTMLEKISKRGEQSLSWQEHQRMKEISEKKREEKLRKR